jgi:hypothetical protein
MLSLTLREFLIVGWAVPTKYRWFHLLKQLSFKVANHHNGSELIIFKLLIIFHVKMILLGDIGQFF